MPVTWDEMSLTFDIRPNESSAERKGRIPWSEIGALIEEVFPVPVPVGTAQISGFGVSLPDYPWLFADSLHIEPETQRITGPNTTQDFDTIVTFGTAVATIRYTAPRYNTGGTTNPDEPDNPDPVVLLEHRWTIGGEFLTIKGRKLKWKDSTDPVPEDINAGILIPTIEHAITWPFIRFPPFTTIRNSLGKINNTAMSFQTGSIEPETLLFLGAELERQILSNGNRAWKVTYRFSERTVESYDGNTKGWNVFWNPIGGQFQVLQNSDPDGTDRDIFKSTDLRDLFKTSRNG